MAHILRHKYQWCRYGCYRRWWNGGWTSGDEGGDNRQKNTETGYQYKILHAVIQAIKDTGRNRVFQVDWIGKGDTPRNHILRSISPYVSVISIRLSNGVRLRTIYFRVTTVLVGKKLDSFKGWRSRPDGITSIVFHLRVSGDKDMLKRSRILRC